VAAWSIRFYTVRKQRAGNCLLEKPLIPPCAESKLLEAPEEEGDLPACLVLLRVFLIQPLSC